MRKMLITFTNPKVKNSDAFISAVPDAPANKIKLSYVQKGKKLQISLIMTQPLLERIDKFAVKLGQSRAGIINLVLYFPLWKVKRQNRQMLSH